MPSALDDLVRFVLDCIFFGLIPESRMLFLKGEAIADPGAGSQRP